MDPELALVKEFIFPVDSGHRFQGVKKKIVRLAPRRKKEEKAEKKELSGKPHECPPLKSNNLLYPFYSIQNTAICGGAMPDGWR